MDETNRSTNAPSRSWLSYSLTRSINAGIRRQFLQHFPDPDALGRLLSSANPILDCADAEFAALARQVLPERAHDKVQRRVDEALSWQSAGSDRHILGLDHPDYPAGLLATSDPPPVLYVRGKLAALALPAVAIVGSRKASRPALEHAAKMAACLANAGIAVSSGLALGIDAAAHRGTLAVEGTTIAVAATAPNRVYPARHRQLATDIAANGAIISEFPLGSQLRPGCFPRRNRLISGISLGVVVVEAALPSGSLTTAQHAIEQGREVMALPGSILNPLAKGCHALIRQGAALIESGEDILATLAPELQRQLAGSGAAERSAIRSSQAGKHSNSDSLDPDALLLLDCLGFDPASADTLVRRTGLSPARIASALTLLELTGDIAPQDGGRYTRCKHSTAAAQAG